MKLSVTPLGSVGRSAGQVAGAVVEYLEGGVGDPGTGLLAAGGQPAGGDGLASYYGDSKEGPGRWIGLGAAAHGLSGVVDRDSVSRVLEGRHPHTGERLVTAQGSSQRSHLAAGTASRFDEWGSPLYAAADTARLVGLSKREVDAMIAAGALETVEVDGRRLVPDAEIGRLLEEAAGPAVERIAASGAPGDWLSGPQAARLLGVSPRYVRRIGGRGADGIELDGAAQLPSERVGDKGAFRIRRSDLAEFAANRKPPVARVGFDVTLTTEKSFGVVMMLAEPSVRLRFAEALRAANDVAVGHLDQHAAVGRRRGEVVGSHGLVGATYFHGTSRGLDPHPHHHNVIANAVVDDEGGVRSLDARALYLHAPEAAALATAAARWELRDLGLGWWQRSEGMWEIAGVDEATIDAFSSRHRDIREVRDALEAQLGRPVTTEEDRRIWAETRAAKTGVDPAELLADWRARAGEVGFDVDRCLGHANCAVAFERLDDQLTRDLFADLVDPTTGVCSKSDRFDRGDVVRAVVDWSTVDEAGERRKVLLPPAEVSRLADEFLGQRQVIGLSAALSRGAIRRRDGQLVEGGQPIRTYTTAEMVWTQSQIIVSWRAGRGDSAGVVDQARVEVALDASTVSLSDEQRHLVSAWCTSGDRVQGAVGRAGAGKTTATAAAARAWESAGYRVIGSAVKGEAARQLADDAGIESDTLALLLARIRRHEPVLDERTVVIVDEGSTIGDRELLELMQECALAGATLRIIGDPAQHHSVTAGGCWSYLVGRADTPELATVHRLRDEGERRRAEAVRGGGPSEVLAELEAAGQLVWSDSDQQTYAAMIERWYQARGDGAAHPMVHGRNRERRLLNHVAQQVLIGDGVVDDGQAVQLSDGRRLFVGDEVIARHGDRRIHPDGDPKRWMRNGTTGTITAISPSQRAGDVVVTIATAGGDLVVDRSTIERKRGGIDLAYAVTSYAVQGSTRDRSTSAVAASTSKSELYVDITRGRDSNIVFGTRRVETETADTDRHLPVIDRALAHELSVRLARPDGLPVVIADRHVVDVTRVTGDSLAKLHADLRTGADGAWDEAIERREAFLRTTAAVPERFGAVLPDTPRVPHLQARYRLLAGDVAVWTETHNAAKPRPTMSPLERAVGLRPRGDGAAASDWDELIERMVRLAVDTTLHRLAIAHPDLAGRQQGSGWLGHWLDSLARRGRLAGVDVDQLAEKVTAVADWRQRHRVSRSVTAPLGRIPRDKTARAEYRRLQADLDRFAGTSDADLTQGVA